MVRNLKIKKPILIIGFIIFIFLLIFTRFYNLDRTARFIWDESSDLVRMHQFYVEKIITLVGPINESGTRIYSSLIYYILLPFAILGKFDPVSPVWGTAFWGIITALLLIFLTKKLNPKLTILIAVLTLVWFPLVETSRWAWNPNLIPLWSTLGILFLFKKKPFYFLSGFFFGLTVHQHYLSLFSVLGFFLIILVLSIRKKNLWRLLFWILGIILTIIPFIIFDLRHPPGLFFSRIIYASPVEEPLSVLAIFSKAFVWIQYMLKYYTQSTILSFALGFSILMLLITDIKSHSKGILFAIPWITQVVGLIYIYNPGPIYYYYLLPSTIPFLVWIIIPRKNYSKALAYLLLAILLTGGFYSIVPKLTKTTWQTDIKSVKEINSFISKNIQDKTLKNVNIAVLESPDNNTYGRRYRDLLLLQNINLRTKDEYDLSDHLFVISTGSEKTVRTSPAFEMHNFRSGPLVDSLRIVYSDWKVYHFTRNIKDQN